MTARRFLFWLVTIPMTIIMIPIMLVSWIIPVLAGLFEVIGFFHFKFECWSVHLSSDSILLTSKYRPKTAREAFNQGFESITG